MSWHGDDDAVDNDSVGWFSAKDYETSPESQSSKDDYYVANDSYGWFNARDYPRNRRS